MANEINSSAKYRRAPNLTFLFEDDVHVTIDRAQKRNDMLYSEDEIKLVCNANELCLQFTKLHKNRIKCLNKQTMTPADIV